MQVYQGDPFFYKQAANGLLAAKKVKMHAPKLTSNHISKDLLLQFMQAAAISKFGNFE